MESSFNAWDKLPSTNFSAVVVNDHANALFCDICNEQKSDLLQ
jgi:hypothetical protein